MKIKQIAQFFVAGLIYSDCDLNNLKLPRNAKLTLVFEPENPHDNLAIRIEYKGTKLGYVPRESNDESADDLRVAISDGQKVRVVVHQFVKTNPSHRMILVRAYSKSTTLDRSNTVPSF